MKKLLAFICLISIAFSCFACYGNIQEVSEIPNKAESSVESEEISFYESESISEDSSSKVAPEEIYDFLNSEYYLTSKQECFDTVFVCRYYFVDGVVAGVKLMTTLPGESSAIEYYKTIIKDYPDAELKKLTVTHYIADDEAYYYGYTLEKLKFVLEKADYKISLSFDEELFYAELSEDASE